MERSRMRKMRTAERMQARQGERPRNQEDREEGHYCMFGSLNHANAFFMKGLVTKCSRHGRT